MARTVARQRDIVNMALGATEAAAVMGVHWSVPPRMADRGWIAARTLETTEGQERRVQVYDGLECQTNWEEYDRKVVERGGMNDRRPRAWVHTRDPILTVLARVPQELRIPFDDAISAYEASEILRVHPSFVPRLAKAGHIVGRELAGRDRTKRPHRPSWIFSRASCVRNLQLVRSLQAEGDKAGRPRNLS